MRTDIQMCIHTQCRERERGRDRERQSKQMWDAKGVLQIVLPSWKGRGLCNA